MYRTALGVCSKIGKLTGFTLPGRNWRDEDQVIAGAAQSDRKPSPAITR
jgi:hypothetical protein